MFTDSIVFLDAGSLAHDLDLGPLKQFGNLTVYESTDQYNVADRIQAARVVLTNKVPISATSLRSSLVLELIVVTASVADMIDLAEARRRKVVVRTIQGYATTSVAQFTIGLMLNLACRIRYYSSVVDSGQYSGQTQFAYLGSGFMELAGKQVGIIGLGSIGTRVAEIAQSIGARIAYYSTTGRHRDARFVRLPLDDLLRTSDVVSIHAPRNPATENLIDLKALAKMRKSALLLNVGRGGIVNEADLMTALSEGLIAGAALDVFEAEPLALTSPLLARIAAPNNLILTPHCAWGGDNAQAELVKRVSEIIGSHFGRSGSSGPREGGHA